MLITYVCFFILDLTTMALEKTICLVHFQNSIEVKMPQYSTGLAFSGGGIRSAAFCSGVLRSLLKNNVEVDYLSCVSGGGYTGTAYLDWKCREENKDKSRKGEGERDWHEKFFNHMKDRSGYICDWTGFCKGVLDAFFFISLISIVLLVHPVIQWGMYAFPVAVMIDLFGFGNLMRKAADCDAVLERQREENESAVPAKDIIDRCLSRSPKRDIAILFFVLFAFFLFFYALNSSAKKFFSKHPCSRSVLLLLEYSTGSVLIFTFIPFTIYDFFVKIPVWAQVVVGILAVVVWVTIPFLRKKVSYVLIVYMYSFVIYLKVFRVDLPLFFIKHEDRHFHWLLCALELPW